MSTKEKYIVHYVSFPAAVEACTVPNDDGTFDIYINAGFDAVKRDKILAHEIQRIIKYRVEGTKR